MCCNRGLDGISFALVFQMTNRVYDMNDGQETDTPFSERLVSALRADRALKNNLKIWLLTLHKLK